jgi:hypothetical protein
MGDCAWGNEPMNRTSNANAKGWLPGVCGAIASIFLLYNVKDYPCLRGAGLALADFEAFMLTVVVALPCFLWSLFRLFFGDKSAGERWENKIIDGMAIFSLLGAITFFAFSAHLILFTAKYPIKFLCESPHLQWLFRFPM